MHTCKEDIIIVSVSVEILTLALVILRLKVKKDKRKGEDLLSFELDISPAPTKNEQSEVKRQHKKEAAIEEVGEVGEVGFGSAYKGKLLAESRKSGEGWGESKNEAMLIAKLQFLVAALKEMATNYSQGCEGQQHFVG